MNITRANAFKLGFYATIGAICASVIITLVFAVAAMSLGLGVLIGLN